MVSVTVSIPGKGPQSFDFPGKTAAGVTVGDLKSAIRAKVPKVCAAGRSCRDVS